MSDSRYSRQSFLGEGAQDVIERAKVGLAGLGGGGSHIAQQLAHVGFMHYVLYDGDVTKDHNLNRNVGAAEHDAVELTLKIEVASRLIEGLRPEAKIEPCPSRWQENPELLKGCDIIFGCVDGFTQRRELEAFARRHLIPLIDIGMDVHCVGDEPPRMAGQIILSMPGGPCMFCLGFLNEKNLAREGEAYGDAGINPQVVWANGVLASTAVGLAVDLLTDWTRSLRKPVWLSYDGNAGTVMPDPRLSYLKKQVRPHYPLSAVGDPIFRPL